MENNVLIKDEQALGTDQLLKLTTLVYFKEALVNQQFETCKELIETAKTIGVNAGEITAVIAEYLNASHQGKPKTNRLHTIKEV